MDAPESMVSMYLEQIKDDMKKRNQPIDEAQMNENYKSHAEWNIKWYLLKNKIVQNESLDISNDEIDGKIEEMIDKIIDFRVSAGQLSECPLTMGELTRIKGKVDGTTGLLPVLRGFYHIRIEYPDSEKDEASEKVAQA